MACIKPLTENGKKDGKRTGRWYAQINLGRHPETGKTRFVSKTFAREKEAKEWATKLEGQRNEGLYRPRMTKGELPRNPTDGVTLPKPDVQAEIVDEYDEELAEVQYLSREQAVRFVAAAQADRFSALWHVLLDGGLRPGEAFALQWRHIDWD